MNWRNESERIAGYMKDERGVETLEWIVVGALVVALGILVYQGALVTQLTAAVNAIGAKITGLVSSGDGGPRTCGEPLKASGSPRSIEDDQIVKRIVRILRGEAGVETLEWIVMAAMLATMAALVYRGGPEDLLRRALVAVGDTVARLTAGL